MLKVWLPFGTRSWIPVGVPAISLPIHFPANVPVNAGEGGLDAHFPYPRARPGVPSSWLQPSSILTAVPI